MPANNVDLTAILPVLTAARKPFADAVAQADKVPLSARPSDATLLRNFAPLSALHLGDARRLIQAIDAIYNVAGVKP